MVFIAFPVLTALSLKQKRPRTATVVHERTRWSTHHTWKLNERGTRARQGIDKYLHGIRDPDLARTEGETRMAVSTGDRRSFPQKDKHKTRCPPIFPTIHRIPSNWSELGITYTPPKVFTTSWKQMGDWTHEVRERVEALLNIFSQDNEAEACSQDTQW
ncbi:hypothetical protein E2P81_ATG08629 [Venturia nashicola]|nr:hypothetical protein E2P81_ATG08629 [Venturia nashicola]